MAHLLKSPFVILRRSLLLAVLLAAGCASPDDRAQSYYERGMKLISQKEYVKASIEFKNALQLKKDLVGAWRGLAQIEEHNRNWQALAGNLRTIVELDPKDVESRLKLGQMMVVGNELDKALDLVNEADAIDNRNARVLALRGAILLRLNDSAGAKREAQAALEVDPNSAEALLVLSAERVMRGDAQGALSILERQASVHENELGIQLFKLSLLQKLKDFDRFESLLRKLAEIYPQEPAFRKQLIKFYVDHKRPDDAEKELRSLLAANPTGVEIGVDLVRFILLTKGAAAARQELLNLIATSEQAFRYQIALADFDLAQGDVTQSVQLLEKLAKGASREQAVSAQIKLAEAHLSKRNVDAAETVVSEVLRQDSRNVSGLKLRAFIRMQNWQLDAAIADARQALNDQPRSSELMLLLAQAYERSGSIELAEKQYADAIKASNFDAAVGLNYAAFLRRRGNSERAEDILTELATRWPGNLNVLSTLADVRLRRQNWIGAQEIAEKMKQIGDDRGLADQIAGAAFSGSGRYVDSIKALESAYAAAPAAVQPMVALVSGLVRAQKLDRAVAFLQTVLQTNPDNADANVLLGSVQLLKNAPDQALKSYQTAIERQPKNMVGYRALAEFHLRQKNVEEALRVTRAALQEVPNSFGLRFTFAGLLESKGDYEAAIAEYEQLLKQQPGSLVVANNLASLLSEHRTDKASLDRAYFLAVGLRRAQVPHFKDTLGWVYHQRGEHKNAISLLEEAAVARPDVALVRYHLGMSYLADGQTTKASEQFKKALELAPDSALQQKIQIAQSKAAI
jgi:tetratricopeptide (TPR) repeat protein